jgi:hypothetical protein
MALSDVFTGTGTTKSGTTIDLNIAGTTGVGEKGPLFGTDFDATKEYDPDLWKSQTLGDISFLKPFFEAAKKGLELHKANAAFIKEIYELNKALMFATIDPIFAAIQAILDEILKLLADLRGLGFYMLSVHAGAVEPNVERNPVTGSLFFGKDVYVPATRVPAVGRKGSEGFIDTHLTAAGKLDPIEMDPITGEMNYVEAPEYSEEPLEWKAGATKEGLIDQAYIKMNNYTGLMSLTPGGILQTIDKSFDDLGDVPKSFKRAFAVGGTDLGLGDYVPNVDITKFADLIDPSYYKSGRPIMSDSATVGGIIFIIGMPDFDKFKTILEKFTKLIEIKGFVTLLEDIKKLWSPAAVTHKLLLSKVARLTVAEGKEIMTELQTADTIGHAQSSIGEVEGGERLEGAGLTPTYYVLQEENSGMFEAQDPDETNRIISNTKHVYARVKRVIESVPWLNEKMDMNAGKSMASTDLPLTESRIRQKHIGTKVNRNPLPYMNQTLEIEYIESGNQEFQAGDIIYEAKPSAASEIIQTSTSAANQLNIPETATDARKFKSFSPDDQRETMYHQVKEGTCTVGIVVDAYDDNALPESPNWSGKSLESLFPALGPLLNRCEAEVKGIKASVASAKKTLDPIIAWLDGKMADVQAFAKDIEEILELFANGIPATGMYSLYLEPRPGGVTKFRERMMGAGGDRKPPESLKFCAGVCFLGGGPTGNPLLRSIDMLALLLGLRQKTAEEVQVAAEMEVIATPTYDPDKPNDINGFAYLAGEIVSWKGTNYVCIANAPLGESPLMVDEWSGKIRRNSTYWSLAETTVGDDEEVTLGDSRTSDQLAIDKIAWLKEAKIALAVILDYLDGTPPGDSSLRTKIMDTNRFGSIDISTGEFTGEDRNIYEELTQLRENDLRELELLIQRITELIQAIEINLIQESLKLNLDAVTPKGSFRSIGKTLMIIKGEFVDEIDGTSFETLGHRQVKPNTTITILHPLLDSSGATRSVESLSNTTIAVLEEEFPVDLEEALSYNIILNNSVESVYKHRDENKIAGTNTYYHPGYRLREYKAKANTVSIAVPNSAGEYTQLPVWEAGQAGPQGDVRTTAFYPEGTVVKINGTVPVSETYISDDTGLEIVRAEEEQDVASTWMALGVSENDKITVDFGSGTGGPIEKAVDSTIGEEYIKVEGAFIIGTGSPEIFLYHEDWSFAISAASEAEAAKSAKIQSSRNDFATYLKEINDQADIVYDYLTILEAKAWPVTANTSESSTGTTD